MTILEHLIKEKKDEFAYYKINREERNFVSILYHLLFYRDNLKRFLKYIEHNKNIDFAVPYVGTSVKSSEIYLEFAFIRDVWHRYTVKNISKKTLDTHNENNTAKESFIRELLGEAGILKELGLVDTIDRLKNGRYNYQKFNRFFGGKSKNHIESPGNWRISAIIKKFKKINRLNKDTEKFEVRDAQSLFIRTCMLKWSFNIKPDLVILLPSYLEKNSLTGGICIEASLESRVDRFPGKTNRGFNKILEGYDEEVEEEKDRDDELVYLAGETGERTRAGIFQTSKSIKPRHVSITRLQEFMFEKVLGIKKIKCIKLLNTKPEQADASSSQGAIYWEDVFNVLEFPDDFLIKYIDKNETLLMNK